MTGGAKLRIGGAFAPSSNVKKGSGLEPRNIHKFFLNFSGFEPQYSYRFILINIVPQIEIYSNKNIVPQIEIYSNKNIVPQIEIFQYTSFGSKELATEREAESSLKL